MEELLKEAKIHTTLIHGKISYCTPDCAVCEEYTALSRCYECRVPFCKKCEPPSNKILYEAYEIYKKEFDNPYSFERFIDSSYDWSIDRALHCGAFYLYSSAKKVRFMCKRCEEFEKTMKDNSKLKVLLLSQKLNRDMIRNLIGYLKDI